MTVYKKRDIDKRLAEIGAEPLYKEGRDYATTYNGVRIPGIIVTHKKGSRNEVPDIAVNKLARKIADIGDLNISYIKKILIGRKRVPMGGLEGIATGIIAILSGVVILFTLIQKQVLTGFAVSENASRLNMGIVICILGIVGLVIYKLKKRG